MFVNGRVLYFVVMPNYTKMKQTDKFIVAFVDILGFKKFIEAYDKGENPELLNKISTIVETVITFLKDKPNYQTISYNKWKEQLKIKSFSDCFCIAIPYDYEGLPFEEHVKLFYQHIAMFQTEMFRNGFLVRGGISIGSFYIDENIIFSGALVKAYKLESKKACYPRILVSESFIESTRLINPIYRERMFINELSETFINPFNYFYVDSEKANQDKDLLEKALPGTGFIDGDFNEISLEQKKQDVSEILDLFLSKESEFTDDARVVDKYKWLLDLCNYELGRGNDRFKNINSRA